MIIYMMFFHTVGNFIIDDLVNVADLLLQLVEAAARVGSISLIYDWSFEANVDVVNIRIIVFIDIIACCVDCQIRRTTFTIA